MRMKRLIYVASFFAIAQGCSTSPTNDNRAAPGGSASRSGPNASPGVVDDAGQGSAPSGSSSGGYVGSGSSGGAPDASVVALPTDASSIPSIDASGVPSTADGSGGPPHDASLGTDASSPGIDAAPTPVGDGGAGWDTVPTILSRIVPPVFRNVDCDITKYGGVGDGTTDNTAAFAAAIADCAAGGGGRVVVPAAATPSVFFTGPIELKSNINLYVSAGSTIRFTTDATKYLPVVEVSWEGSLAMNYRPLISAHDATNVAITGTGTIDGNASLSDWYSWRTPEIPDQTNLRMQNASGLPPAQRIYGAGHFLRPSLIEFLRCTNVLFDGFTAQNSPFWTIHPVLSTNVTARNFRSVAPVPNTDGFDPESCTDVLVQNATIQVGDDALAIKAGRDRDGWTYYKPSENIVIQHSNLTSHVGGITIGSEMSAGVRNVYVENSTFSSTAGNLQFGFYIKSAITRGGYIRDIYARQITVVNVGQFFQLTAHYVSGAVVGTPMPTDVSNINLDGITVAQSNASPFFIAGADATHLATGIHFNNVNVSTSPSPALASGSGHYTGLTMTGVVVNGAPFNPPASAP
jgi:polygalacturonase